MKVLHAAERTDAASGVMTFVSRLDAALRDAGLESAASFGLDDFVARAPACDIVHLHGLWTPWLHGAFREASRLGKRVVWSTHGMTAPWAMRHKAWKKLPYWWLRQRRDLALADAIHATTELEGGWNRRAIGPSTAVFTVPVGTDEKRGPGATRDSNIVLFVGRLHPVKGLENLIRAFAACASRNAVLRLVGPDGCGYAAKLRRLAASLGVAERVEMAGGLFGADLSRQYDECAFLVLSSFTENFGAVVADALAHGKCAIASRFTPWKALEERGCGWWVDNAPDALAAAIDSAFAAQKSGELERMGERAAAFAAERFSWPAIARSMAEEYSRIASSRKEHS